MKPFLFLIILLLMTSPLHADDTFPAPWKHQDIGPAEVPGSATHDAGVFTLQGTMDIWGPADGCHLMWQPLHGDGELVARVTAMENPGGVGHAKAGLCIRGTLDPGARNVAMCVTAVDGTQFLYRENKDDKTARVPLDPDAQKAGVPKKHFPCWLKIVRRGNEFSGYESADGETWAPSGKITLALPADAILGLTSSSHVKNILCKSTFDHVIVTPALPSAPRAGAGGRGAGGKLPPGQVAQVTTINIDGSDPRIVYQTTDPIQASKRFAYVAYPILSSEASK